MQNHSKARAMTPISIEDAQARSSELIRLLKPGEELIITENNQPVARLLPAGGGRKRTLGTLQGTVQYMAPDFDAPLDDFREYMQ